MRKTLSGLRACLWIGLLLLPLRSFADVPACPAGYTVGFFNGVGNTELEAQDGLAALRDAFREANNSQSDIYDHEDVAFQYFYNHTGSTVGASVLQDVAEVFIQRAHELDPSGSLEEKYFYLVWEPVNGTGPGYGNAAGAQNDGLANFLSSFANAAVSTAAGWLSSKFSSPPTEGDYAKHRAALDVDAAAGRKMLLVAHSQGNLFVNVAYNYIQPIVSSARVKLVHIAPASTVINGPWTLANIDLVINALRLDGGVGSVPDNNLFTTPSASDKSGHTLVGTYLDGTRPGRGAVQALMMSQMVALDAPQCPMTMSPPAYVASPDEHVVLNAQIPTLPVDPNVFIVTYSWAITGNAGGYFIDPNNGAHVPRVDIPAPTPSSTLTYIAPASAPAANAVDTVTVVANLTNIEDATISTKPYATASMAISFGSGCYDLTLLTPGSRVSVTYQIGDGANDPSAAGILQDDTVAKTGVFQGAAVLEQDEVATKTSSSSPGTNTSTSVVTYDALAPPGAVTLYGSIVTTTQPAQTTTLSATYTPPTVDTRAQLSVGESVTLAYSGTEVSSSSTSTGSRTDTFGYQEAWTFVSRENVTVTAGTYPACKFTHTTVGLPTTYTDWVIYGNGTLVKREVRDATGALVSFENATSVKINGVSR